MKIETKYDINQKIWVTTGKPHKYTKQCEDCNGAGYIFVINGNEQEKRECRKCEGAGKIRTNYIHYKPIQSFIDNIEVRINNDSAIKFYYNLGDGSYERDESEIFLTKQDAIKHCESLNKIKIGLGIDCNKES